MKMGDLFRNNLQSRPTDQEKKQEIRYDGSKDRVEEVTSDNVTTCSAIDSDF